MKITPERLRKIIKEELEAVLAEGETKTPDSLIADLKAAKRIRRQMTISDLEDVVYDWPNADPNILKYYPNWKKEDFQKVIDAFES
jgi:hypothetical protein